MITQQKIDEMREALAAGVQVVTAPQLFETPRDLARRMAALADLSGLTGTPKDELKILEPSAGTGRLVDAIKECDIGIMQISLVEQSPELYNALATKYGRVFPGDFLDRTGWELHGPFDRILMNPPFKNGEDIKHVLHALEMLKPGGRLVGICAGGPRQERQIKPLASYWQALPAGTFKEAGTMVNSVLFTVDKEDE